MQLTFYQYDTVMCRIDRWFHHVEEHQWWPNEYKLTYPCESNTSNSIVFRYGVFSLSLVLSITWLSFNGYNDYLFLVFTVIVFFSVFKYKCLFVCLRVYSHFTFTHRCAENRLLSTTVFFYCTVSVRKPISMLKLSFCVYCFHPHRARTRFYR